jgi:2-polyprenyl-6-methoxyphenol hydroxylase-like FAD-dependent oxidoreductase
MHALIVGGGIGGLAAALALRKAGLGVTVLERAEQLREIGAGLTLWPNGVAALRAVSITAGDKVFPIRSVKVMTAQGRLLREMDCTGFEDRYGAPAMPIHRAQLQLMLLSDVGLDYVVLGANAITFDQDATGVAVGSSDGRTWSGDLLVGADGVHSMVRQRLLGDGDPSYTGVSIWRGVAEASPAGLSSGESRTYLGVGHEFGYMPMIDGRVYWFASKEAPEGETPWPQGHKAELRRRYGSWPAPIADLIDGTPEDDVVRTDIYDRPPVKRWTEGRIALLGDAAHPMTPHASQGACQALEDAVVLGRSFEAEQNATRALQAYQGRRLARANSFVRLSSQTGRMIRLKNGIGRWLRDQALLRTPSSVIRRQQDTQLRFLAD